MRRRRGIRAPCHRIASNVTPTAPSALYATRAGGPGGLTIIAILDLLGGAAQCMVAAGPMHGIQLPATDATKWMALYGGLCKLAGGVWVKYYEFSRTVFGARPGPGLAATDSQASSAPGCALLPAAAEQHRRASTRFTSMLGRSTLRIM